MVRGLEKLVTRHFHMVKIVGSSPTPASYIGHKMIDDLFALRKSFEKAFHQDTAYKQQAGKTPSHGHCAIVAELVRQRLGGKIFACNVDGQPHRYNHIEGLWVDLTADQFGLPQVCISSTPIYEGCRHREVKSGMSKDLILRIERFSVRM